MRHSHIFFDLDGTLIDSKPGIIRSVEHALNFFDIHIPSEKLVPFIGPPLRDSFAQVFPDAPAKVELAIQKYREYYSAKGIFECNLYSGIRELLAALHAEGRSICLATSKPEPFAQRILTHFGIDGLFDFVAGAELHGARNSKTAVLRYACEHFKLKDAAFCLMVGDRKYDVRGAHDLEMACAGVLYGYGTREELTEAGADYICPGVADVRRLLSEGISD